MVDAKTQLRREARRMRDSISPSAAAAAARSAACHLLVLPAVRAARTVALYAPIRGELDVGPVAGHLAEGGARVVYPRVVVRERSLTFHEVGFADGAARLSPGVFGIPEPSWSAPIVPVEDIDVFVVPGLAFDPTGARLGWGGGFYDRTLAAAASAVRIGYCFACQIVAQVPCGREDVSMHFLVTEAGASPSSDGDADEVAGPKVT